MFNTSVLIITALIAAAVVFAAPAISRRGPTEGTPVPFDELDSIGDVLAAAKSNGKTVHIVYVHGMRAQQSGASGELLKALHKSKFLQGFNRVPLELKDGQREAQWQDGKSQKPIEYAGKPLLPSTDAEWEKAWIRSSPFIVRTTFKSADPKTTFQVIIEEVNWWPLLMGLRCRALVGPDSGLSGAGDDQIEFCMKDASIEKGDPYYPWLKSGEIKAPPIGRSAWANRYVKHNIINWGFADAVIALGPMRHYLRKAMDWASEKATEDAADERILIAESLGSFVAMDAAREGGPTLSLVEKTQHFYFLANQFALLEMARIKGLPASAEFMHGDSAASAFAVLDQGGMAARGENLIPPPAQVVAISDPSDVLTFLVPKLKRSKVSNIQARFSAGPPALFANPLKAHRGGIEGHRRIWKHLLKEHRRQQ